MLALGSLGSAGSPALRWASGAASSSSSRTQPRSHAFGPPSRRPAAAAAAAGRTLGGLAHAFPHAGGGRGGGRRALSVGSGGAPAHAAAPADSESPTGGGASEATAADGKKLRVLSGVQPTGSVHLGNYFGAIRQWVALQETHDPLYCVVDLHAITAPHDPKELRESTLSSAALYLACGVDPARSTVFVQSQVPQHAELTWLLNCSTPLNWLERMIQYKEKRVKQGENVGVGLLDYPVLMAADILLYDTAVVPVGEDQRQHLELARDIASSFNHNYGGRKWKKRGGQGGSVFRPPEALITAQGARVMSLDDGRSKMSKSNPNEGSRINVLDPPDVIAAKVKRCKSDAPVGIVYGDAERPECENLLCLYQLCSGQPKDSVAAECASLSWGDFKPRLTEAIVTHLAPIQARYVEIYDDKAALHAVLNAGADTAQGIAQATLDRARDAMGFVPARF